MKILELIRYYTPMGTFGELGGRMISRWCTVEKEWVDNEKYISCIPEDAYLCERTDSPRFGETFEVVGVPNRFGILFHVANFEENVQGCIGLGTDIGTINDRWAVLNSKDAFREFMEYMEGEDEFILDIRQYKP